MCLISKYRFPKRAKADITCYKVLEIGRNSEDTQIYYTPFMDTPVHVPGILKAEGSSIRFGIFDSYEVGKGYIHAYHYEHTAKVSSSIYDFRNLNNVVVECTIPKGTKYHINESGIEICAKKMIINKIVHIHINEELGEEYIK